MAETEIDVLKGTTLHLQTSQPLDVSSMFGVDYNRLFGGVQVRTVALHPRQPIVAVAALGMLAEFDLPSRCKFSSTEVASTVVCMSYNLDASMLICLTAERGLIAFSPQTLRRRTLLEPTHKTEKLLKFAHLAISAGPKPLIFFCQHGSAALRLVQTAPSAAPGSRGTDKQGTTVKMDSKRNLVGLAGAPQRSAASLHLLSGGNAVMLPKGGVTQAQLCAEAHPFLPGGVLLGLATNMGSVALLEMMARSEARLIGRDKVSTIGPIIVGLGFNLATSTLMVFMKDKKGHVHASAWQLIGAQEASSWARLSLEPALLRDVMGDAFGPVAQPAAPDQATSSPDQAWKGLWTASPPWIGNGSVAASSEDVVRVHVHRILGTTILQWRGRSYWEGVGRTPIGQLDVADAAGARRLLSLGVVDAVDAAQVAASLGQPSLAPHHSVLDAWSPSAGRRVEVPNHIYLIDNGHLSFYSPVTDKVAVRASLPRTNAGQQALAVQKVEYSSAQAAWLLFFRVMTSAGAGSKIEAGSYQFTLLFEADAPLEAESAVNPWLLPGVAGAFAGAHDEYYAVLSNSSLVVKVYATKATSNKPPAVRKLEVGLRGALGIFPGPPWTSLPKWVSPPLLFLGPTPACRWYGPSVALFLLSSSPVPPQYRHSCCAMLRSRTHEVVGSGNTGPGSRNQRRERDADLAVAKRSSVLERPDGPPPKGVAALAVPELTSPPTASLPSSLARACCRWRGRALLDLFRGGGSATLRLIASTPLLRVACPHHLLPVGRPRPALLQLCPPGTAVGVGRKHCAGVLPWGRSPGALAAALPDRLLVARGGTATGHVEVSARYAAMLQPLLLGWASLAARGILPGGLWRARRHMGILIGSYDSSMVTADLLRTLVAQGFSDVALALSGADAPHLAPGDVAAVQAGAGKWKDAVHMALAEYRRSIYYPGAPAPGSALKTHLVAVGRAMAAYGHFVEARECWQAAGQWAELLPLLVMQADFDSLEHFAKQGPVEARSLAETLLKTAGPHYNRVASLGSSAVTGNWQVTAELEAGTLGTLGQSEALEVAPSGAVPSMEAVPPEGLPSSSDALGYIPRLDPSLVEAYIGVGQGVVRGATVVRATDDRPEDDVDGGFMEASVPGTGGIDDGDHEGGQFAETAAQAAARAAFSMDKADNFYSSDEEGDDTHSNSSLSTSTSLAPDKPKFKVVIRGKEEAGPSDAGDPNALRSAAQNLRLIGAPPTGLEAPSTFKFKRSGTDLSSGSDGGALELSPRPSDSSSLVSPSTFPRPPLPPLFPSPTTDAMKGNAPPMIPEGLFGPAPEPSAGAGPILPPPAPLANPPAWNAPIRVPSPGPTPLRVPSPGPAPLPDDFLRAAPAPLPAPVAKADVSALQRQGISLMEAGQWDAAAAQLSSALAASGGGGARSAHYLAAVKLLKVAATAEKLAAARLYRFAASLPLDEVHRRAVIMSAAARNLDVGNFGYASEQFLWLATQASDNAPDAYLAQLQQKIDECDTAGLRNADIPKDEDLSVFAEIIGAAQNAIDVDECVGPLLV
eukprot:jgi/Botrbrau1/966/Bobra.114_1s0009.1